MNFIPFTFLVLLFCFYQINNKKFGITSLLFVAYLSILLASYLLDLIDRDLFVSEYSIGAMLFFSLCLTVMIFGFMGFRDRNLRNIKIENIYFYKLLVAVLTISSFLSIVFFSPFVISAMTGDIQYNRINFTGKLQMATLGKYGIVNSFFSLIANSFILIQIFAFITLCFGKKQKRFFRFSVMIFSSFSYVFYILAYVGRDGIVYWLMSFVYCMMFFQNFIRLGDWYVLRKYLVVIGLILLVPFLFLSHARFSQSSKGTIWSLLNYSGQQLGNFNDRFNINPPISYGRTAFPVFVNLLEKMGIEIPNEESLSDILLSNGAKPWTFGTFISTFQMNLGKTGAIVLLGVMTIFARKCIRNINKNKYIYLSDLILITTIYQIYYWGIFYFRQYSSNIYLIYILTLVFFLKFTRRLNV